MQNLGLQELFVILLIVLILFGAKRIPEVARSMGKGIREFKKATREISADLDLENDAGGVEKRPTPPPPPENQ